MGLLTVSLRRCLSSGFSLKCIKDKKVPIGVTLVVAALLLAIIALAGKWPRTEAPTTKVLSPPGENLGHQDVVFLFPAKKCPSCPSCPSPILPSCLENGIGYREKCFYFVENEADWNRSQLSCLSLQAHLATIDTPEELVNEKSPWNWCVGGFGGADLGFPWKV